MRRLVAMIKRVLLVLLCLVAFTGCTSRVSTAKTGTSEANGNSGLAIRAYTNYIPVEERIPRAANIYTGEVVDIFFIVCDGVERQYMAMPNFYTVYKVKVGDVYKGAPGNYVNVAVFGCLFGYKEKQQLKILKKYGYEYDVIPDVGAQELEIGKTYAFLTNTFGNYEGMVGGTCYNSYIYIKDYIESDDFDKNEYINPKDSIKNKYKEVIDGQLKDIKFDAYEEDGKRYCKLVIDVYDSNNPETGKVKEVLWHCEEATDIEELWFKKGDKKMFFISYEEVGGYPLCGGIGLITDLLYGNIEEYH
jgi:hypothetical protein